MRLRQTGPVLCALAVALLLLAGATASAGPALTDASGRATAPQADSPGDGSRAARALTLACCEPPAALRELSEDALALREAGEAEEPSAKKCRKIYL